jgi:hypothetical protein
MPPVSLDSLLPMDHEISGVERRMTMILWMDLELSPCGHSYISQDVAIRSYYRGRIFWRVTTNGRPGNSSLYYNL